MTKQNSSPFTLIQGGLSETAENKAKVFKDAYITDTRLMGVVGMYIHWKLPENITYTDFHQFFYFDAEEYGFDTYKAVLTGSEDNDLSELIDAENLLIGGLGGQKVNISEKEARYMVQEYTYFNEREGLELPEGYDEYKFLLTPRLEMDRTEEYVLMSKQCPMLTSPYQILNYFLMRVFGKDFNAAKFLTKNYVRTNIFPEHKAATLFKNTIDPASSAMSGTNSDYYSTDNDADFGTFNTHKSYLCESLIEYDAQYYLIVTQITLDHLRVVKFEKVSSFKVSQSEVAMMLSKPEFITVFDILEGAPLFTHNCTELAKRSMVTLHDSGQLFMVFYPHNNHVNKRIFSLNEDVLGVYYKSDSDQLILSSFTKDGIMTMERDFAESQYSQYAVPVSKYEFKEPILYDFISSNFDDFEDFVDLIADEPDPDDPE